MSTATMNLSGRTVGEVATEIPAAIRVFEKWGIDYCCGGKTTMEKAVAASGRTVEQFEADLSASAAVPSGIDRNWSAESLQAISRFIIDTYHVYTREELETLLALSEKVDRVHGQNHPEVVRVYQLVQGLANDMRPHMLKEEQVLFPYVDELDRVQASGGPAPMPFFGTVKNPVRMMMLEHDAVGAMLAELREVTKGFALPADACFSYTQLYTRLAEFEAKTHEHVHLENNVYFPAAVALEEKIGDPTTASAPTGDAHAAGPCGCSH
jgi:regulator of cell morphogenesis and NO signaling